VSEVYFIFRFGFDDPFEVQYVIPFGGIDPIDKRVAKQLDFTRKLYLGNLPKKYNEEELKKLFEANKISVVVINVELVLFCSPFS
jgi:RNA recognition motif-containing protein